MYSTVQTEEHGAQKNKRLKTTIKYEIGVFSRHTRKQALTQIPSDAQGGPSKVWEQPPRNMTHH